MMNNAVSQATQAQNASANPQYSTFVSANAGSGKTTILTNRIARLLLHGVKPQAILCLTFTKAAAGEVQERIFQRLGEWVLMPEAELVSKLRAIGETDFAPERLDNARQLFAEALETPSGLKVQTIHAFCASILRRFPLEAGVAPNFREIDEEESYDLGEIALRKTMEAEPQLAKSIAKLRALDRNLIKEILNNRDGFHPTWSAEEFSKQIGEEKIIAKEELFTRVDACANLEDQEALLCSLKYVGKYAKAYIAARREGRFDAGLLESIFYTQGGALRSRLHVEGSKFVSDVPTQEELVNVILENLQALKRGEYLRWLALLHRFAGCLLEFYKTEKSRRLLVDYDDLINKAATLLNQNDRLNWVMYRLDGAISHILVDEAQDTNDAQWRVIDAIAEGLAEERDTHRTLFVVGDEKQSIYSFQGADPEVFERKRLDYRAQLSRRDQVLQEEELLVSFRSSPLILDFVDNVFQGEFAQGLGGKVEHQARNLDVPGQIEILPFRFIEETAEKPSWPEIDVRIETSDELVLAKEIADKIALELAQGVLIADEDANGQAVMRAVEPGDYLILLRKRKSFFYAVQNALQERGIPIAGVDSLKLGEELAVKDIMALLRFLHSPFDDLSLACFLRSPIGGFDEVALYQLAAKRAKGESLFRAMQNEREKYDEILVLIESLRKDVDYLRPYDLVAKLLHDFDGEALLRARLGVVVEDVLQSFRDALLRYEANETPSLVGFIAWFDRQELTIKRALDEGLGAVRTMTIHGAKGLEAPIVILPFVNQGRHSNDNLVVVNGVTWMRSSKVPPSAEIADMLSQHQAKMQLEDNRLNYVALTRAKTRLVICGAGKAKSGSEDGFGEGDIYRRFLDVAPQFQCHSINEGGVHLLAHHYPDGKGEAKSFVPAPLREIEFPPLHQTLKTAPQALTNIFEDHQGSKGRGAEYGVLFHEMMEYLPTWTGGRREAMAQMRWGKEPQFAEAFEEAQRVLQAFPEFWSRPFVSEMDFEIEIEHLPIRGRMDLVLLGDEIRVVDYKTNLDIAKNWQDLNKNYQYQLAVYAHALKGFAPDKPVRAAILWSYDQSLLEPLESEIEEAFGEFRQYVKEIVTKLEFQHEAT